MTTIVKEIVVDFDSSDRKTAQELHNKIVDALGHGPLLRLFADKRTDDVMGCIRSIAWCDTRLLGVDTLQFQDGHMELANAKNIDCWWREQGHRLMKIEGFKAMGNTIVVIDFYDNVETTSWKHKTTFVKAKSIPYDWEIDRSLNSVMG